MKRCAGGVDDGATGPFDEGHSSLARFRALRSMHGASPETVCFASGDAIGFGALSASETRVDGRKIVPLERKNNVKKSFLHSVCLFVFPFPPFSPLRPAAGFSLPTLVFFAQYDLSEGMPEPCVNDEESQAGKKERRNKRSSSRSTMPWPRWPPPPPPLQHHHPGGADCACCLAAPSSLHQTLSELDHSRSAAAAAAAGDLARLRTMIDRDPRAGVAPPRGSSDGFTPLHHASRAGSAAAVSMLLAAGADPNAETAAGKATPLHRAAFAGHAEASRLLLRAGADAARGDADGETAAFKAASQVSRLFSLSCFFTCCRG